MDDIAPNGLPGLSGRAWYWLDYLQKRGLSGGYSWSPAPNKQGTPGGVREVAGGGEARPARLHNGQVVWLRLNPSGRILEVFDHALSSDKAIVAAMTPHCIESPRIPLYRWSHWGQPGAG